MNIFVGDRVHLTDGEPALAQARADMATIGLLQERAMRKQQILAEQLQGRSTVGPSSSRRRAVSPNAIS